jgi:hypothetical protein
MSEVQPGNSDIPGQVFESCFRQMLATEQYERAKRIFDEVGAYNERSLAIQFHTAHAFGKLDEVLAAYEDIMSPEKGFLHLVPDEITKAVEVRRFADVIYSSVIAEGDIRRLLSMRREIEIPEMFDLMG